MIFKNLQIDTLDVLEAANSKWNFSLYKPGLVGGHCIGIDPYYLIYKSEQAGYKSSFLNAAREVNNNFPSWIVNQLVIKLKERNLILKSQNVLILGFSYKENCTDIRNTRVIDIINEINNHDMNYDIVDPLVDKEKCKQIYNINVLETIPDKKYSCVILAVPHEQFINRNNNLWSELKHQDCIIIDLKSKLDKSLNAIRV